MFILSDINIFMFENVLLTNYILPGSAGPLPTFWFVPSNPQILCEARRDSQTRIEGYILIVR